MAEFDVPNDRPFGAVKKTEEELSAVPIPRRQTNRIPASTLSPEQQQQPNVVSEEGSYKRDLLANSPLASLPVEVQNNLTMAKMWYEIAMHPASTEFERGLAAAHLDDLDVQQPDEEEKDNSGKSV